MQQFVVPQFIDVEDKIFGPITTRQFLIFLATGLILFLIFRFGDFALFVTSCVVIGGSAIVLAFVRPNGQPFHYFILNLLQTVRKPGIRVWKKEYSRSDLDYLRKLDANIIAEILVKKQAPRRERIRDLALTVNTGGVYKGDEL